ncbi:hypothetical protein FNV43_RR22105 [Rhamnella rubrinervis]|uniref:Uncharacterized protein n=1 Tax=Rhamnella rubrinervis TaxID=2594499 RepID=A0A8K0DVJ1_9ROSA|nr:hypothetical protein FNV43_RR22105 [Rhamnella rubrinervis]
MEEGRLVTNPEATTRSVRRGREVEESPILRVPLLLRQLYNDDPRDRVEFNRVGARFDRKAFAMFTGLNCGKLEAEMRNLSYSFMDQSPSKMGETQDILRLSDVGFHVILMVPP